MKKNKAQVPNIHQLLVNTGFNTSKQIVINNYCQLLVDDTNKRFAIIDFNGCHIFNYSDLLAYEHNEDGEVITSGRGMQTAVGGATFGVVGALVGNSGKRKSQSTCTYMTVRVLLNNLNKPQMELPCLPYQCKKNTVQYTTAKQKASELTATLNYIINNNNQQASNITDNTENSTIQNTQTQQVNFIPMPKPQKSMNQGCLLIIILFFSVIFFTIFVLLLATLSDKTPDTSSPTEINQDIDSLSAIDATAEEKEVMKTTLEEIGFYPFKTITYDELLEGMATYTDENGYGTENGYRIDINDNITNAIIYIDDNNKIIEAKWSDTLFIDNYVVVDNLKNHTISPDEQSYYISVTKETIKTILKSPSTAKFPWNYQEYSLGKENGVFYVQGYVDSQNSFGAEIRSTYTVGYSNDSVVYLVFDNEVVLDTREQ